MALVTLNHDLDIRCANKYLQKILGYSFKEIRCFSGGFAAVLPAEERERCCFWLKGILSGRENLNSQKRFKIIHKSGFIVYCLFMPYFMCHEKAPRKKLLHLMIIDKTDLILRERSAVKDQRLKNIGAIAAEVAHEIKNAIVAIGGFAKRLEKIMPANTEVKIITEQSRRLERLVKSINEYVRPGRAQGKCESVGHILDRTLLLMKPALKSRNIKVDINLRDIPEDIKGDKDALTEVFINIIRNAIQALKANGNLIIRCCMKIDHLCMEFENRMERKIVIDHQNLFKTIEEGGNSIGLPLSFRIMKNLGGNLSFRQQDDLAVFRIELPNRLAS